MGNRITQTSFSRGEITPKLDARVKLEQYDIGLKTAKNAIVHQEGGISNRMGLEYIGTTKYSDKPTRLMKFVFNSEQTYMLEFGDKYIRVIKDGGYVVYPDDYGVEYKEELESFWNGNYSNLTDMSGTTLGLDYSIDVTVDDSTFSLAFNSFDLGMPLFKYFQLGPGYAVQSIPFGYIYAYNNSNNTISIGKYVTHTEIDYDKELKQGQIVEITTPYNANDLFELKKSQAGDILTLTHQKYQTYNLCRYSHYDWLLESIVFSAEIDAPTNVSAVFSTTTPTSNEKTYSYVVTAVDKDTNTESERSEVVEVVAHREANWAASEYITISCDEVLGASEYNFYRSVNGIFGYIGTAQATEDVITVYNNGKFSGKSTLTDPYTGQIIISIKLTADNNRVVYTQDSLKKGNDFYTDSKLTEFYGKCTALTDTSKTKKITLVKRGVKLIDNCIEPDLSSTAPVVRKPFENEQYPSCSAYFQQRKIYANTNDNPRTIFASQTGTINNFNVSRPLVSTDAITMSLDDKEMNEIRHLVPMKDLIVLTSNSEWKVNGTDGIFQANPMPAGVVQSYYGSSHVEPVISGSMILFVQAGGSVIRDLGYDIMQEGYDGDELTIFSSHLFEGKEIVSIAYAKEPNRLLFVVLNDGSCACLTYNKKQKLCGWTRFVTDGNFESVDVVREGLEDTAYFVIKRSIGNNYVKFVERTKTRIINTVSDSFLVDCGLSNEFETAVTQISGLTHLNGKKVVANADGTIITDLIVNNGSVTLPISANKVTVGLPYEFEFETLNLEGENTHGLKKVINYASVKLYKSREEIVFVGARGSEYRNKRSTDSINNPDKLYSKDVSMTILSTPTTEATVHIKQDLPVPITILSVSTDIDVQDNENS